MQVKKNTRWSEINKVSGIIAAALLMVAAANLVLQPVCSYVINHSTFRFSRILRGQVSAEVLVVGSSRGANLATSAKPEGDGEVFNLSYNGVGRSATLALVREYFEHGNRAKHVVIEGSTLLIDSGNCDLKSYWADLPALERVSKSRCQDDFTAAHYLPLTTYDSELFLRALYYAFVRRDGDQNWANDYKMTDIQCSRLKKLGDSRLEVLGDTASPSQIRDEVASLTSWLAIKSPGTTVTIVLGPYFSAPSTRPFVDRVKSVTRASVPAGRYLDLGSALGDSCSDFADFLHVNQDGRKKLRSEFIGYTRLQSGI